jgi:hypothetical protein
MSSRPRARLPAAASLLVFGLMLAGCGKKPAPPPPPPIDLKFFGYSATPGGVRQAFLLHGEDIFLAHEGDVVDRRYRVGRIAPSGIEVTDIPYSSTQTLPLQN